MPSPTALARARRPGRGGRLLRCSPAGAARSPPWWSGCGSGRHPIAVTLAADVVATLVVFAASPCVANASVYDPYWSVAPPVVAGRLDGGGRQMPRRAASGRGRRSWSTAWCCVWAVRLTANWATGWRGLGHEDWRYVRPARRAPPAGCRGGWSTCGGIQLMPTLVVFVGHAARCGRRWSSATARSARWTRSRRSSPPAAIAVEAVADRQLRAFTADPANARHGRSSAACGGGRGTRTTSARSASGGGCGCSALAATPLGLVVDRRRAAGHGGALRDGRASR